MGREINQKLIEDIIEWHKSSESARIKFQTFEKKVSNQVFRKNIKIRFEHSTMREPSLNHACEFEISEDELLEIINNKLKGLCAEYNKTIDDIESITGIKVS